MLRESCTWRQSPFKFRLDQLRPLLLLAAYLQYVETSTSQQEPLQWTHFVVVSANDYVKKKFCVQHKPWRKSLSMALLGLC